MNEVHLHVLTDQGSIIIGARRLGKLTDIRRVKTVREVIGSPNQEDTGQTPTKMISLSLRRVRKETTFTPRIRHFNFPRTRMPSHVKTYDGSGDSEDHLKLFQAAAKTERWAMPTWCHMFNSTLTGNARADTSAVKADFSPDSEETWSQRRTTSA
ncbi:hypothetical protein Tco_0376162, partial [Tanacetum coccineum]